MLFQATIRKRRDTYSRKYREAPHPELHFIKACIYNGSEYVDSDIFILKGALKFALQISERFACCGNNKFYKPALCLNCQKVRLFHVKHF